jgi:hypothetical protein
MCLSGHIVDFTTNTSTICLRCQVLLAAYHKAVSRNTHLFFPIFSFGRLLLCYCMMQFLIHFFIRSVFAAPAPPPPNFAAPGERVVCLAVKPAVIARIMQEEFN